MANITVPIQVNLPEDWLEQIIERLKNDPEAEWVKVIRCKDCKHFPVKHCSWTGFEDCDEDDFCSRAERREE